MATTDSWVPHEERIIIQPLQHEWFSARDAEVFMLRLDLIDPVISGNKWFKLKWNLQQAKAEGFKSILSFGGPYSNHLIAAAAAAQYFGLQSIGIVRGEHKELTHTLKACVAHGMQLHFISREDYKRKAEPEFLAELSERFGHPYIIPEGGANEAGRKGSGEIAQFIGDDFTYICLSVGTGTTLSGIREALPKYQQVIGFAPMKGGKYLKEEIKNKIFTTSPLHDFTILDDYHFGGFGKINDELKVFMQDFENHFHFPLDRVYTAKMMYGVRDLLQKGFFGKKPKIFCIHTGGIQGNS